ncbi:MAG: 4-hydroxy-tetrahydrodipicolinate synthase [Nonlabens sp.]
MQELIGTGVALVTPFDKNNAVDHKALTKLVIHQIDNGIDYLVALGTTAESATLTQQEKVEVLDTIKSANKGRLPLVLGIGGNNTAAVVEEVKSTDLTDYAAILSVSPAYNKPTQKGIYEHFKCVAAASELPIILYNVPGRTASTMSVKTVARLAHDCDNIIGIKEAAGDMVAAMNMIQYSPSDFLVISGDDMLAAATTLAGGAGVISVIGQALSQDFSDMIRYALNGDAGEAYELHYDLAACIDLIFEQGNPAGVKNLLKHLKITETHVRLPLVGVDEDLDNRIGNFLDRYDN